MYHGLVGFRHSPPGFETGEDDMAEIIRMRIPQILKERGLTAADLMYGARIAPGTAYKLASEENAKVVTGISFDVLLKVCRYLDVSISEILQIEEIAED